MSISLITELRQIRGTNNEVIQGAYCLATPSVSYKSTPAASTDPFSSKTNKYAESKIIAVTTITKACHIRFGTSTIGDATTSDYLIPADTTQYFAIDNDYPYARIIENSSAATVVVTEIY